MSERINLDTNEADMVAERREALLGKQNFVGGFIAGIIGALVGAGIWAAATVMTEYQIGFLAIGIGFLVGWLVNLVGKGVTPMFGVMAAILSLLGCVVGSLFILVHSISVQNGTDHLTALANLDLDFAAQRMKDTFRPMDLLFYALAAMQGYRSGFTNLDAE